MSISIHYEVKRKSPASQSEIEAVKSIVEKYSVDSEIKKYYRTRIGLNWEPFDYQFNTDETFLFKKGTIFRGSTKLPDNSDNASWEGVQHWCACLSEIRRLLGNAEWEVTAVRYAIKWNSVESTFDPSSIKDFDFPIWMLIIFGIAVFLITAPLAFEIFQSGEVHHTCHGHDRIPLSTPLHLRKMYIYSGHLAYIYAFGWSLLAIAGVLLPFRKNYNYFFVVIGIITVVASYRSICFS